MSGFEATEKSYRGVTGTAERVRRGGSYLVLLIGAVTFLVPFAWMLTTSLKTPEEIYAYPIRWIPQHPQWHTYTDLFADGPFLRYILNSVLITFVGVAFSLIGSSFAAYAFARLRFPGRDALFFVMLATIMVPAWSTLIPSFVMFGLLGWLDTYLPILVPALFATPFNTFLLRQFFLSIPRELEDAAKVDGASTLRCFLTVVLPLARPALIIVALFAFLFYWNDFLGPLIYLSSQDKFPISLGIMNFVGEKSQDFASMMAAATVAMAPCVVLFFIAQRWFVQGVVITGVKG
ncbi:carbohydrate ABC transporter permease [Microlunatus soli]|uniref:Carbohydrate ABC transporter membrane protein 2, CUT1 family n=1 Tax=Microlunatus soli TaxID=630515 RepID=A0A1H1RM43_9ACTN|nr:carbohydrate ABC transporter permease [Microlunatus soli]SDS36768.1 carbohydrate ABC transporter membrane protein 2, CUT1 family [Microlunatus soli]